MSCAKTWFGMKNISGRSSGARYCAIEKNEASYIRRLTSLFSYIKTNRRIQGYCYTQFTDVMQETNGLLSIRREPKIAIDAIRSILFGTDDSAPLSPVP